MADPTTDRPAKAIPVDANVRALLAAALLRGGGTLTLTHLEIGEATIASFRADITVEQDREGAIIRLVEKPEADRA